MERSHKICVNCGYDFDSGQLLNTRIVRPEEIVPWWLHVLRFIADCYPGLFRPLTLIAFIFFVILFVAIEILALTVLFMGAFVSAFMVAVAGMMVPRRWEVGKTRYWAGRVGCGIPGRVRVKVWVVKWLPGTGGSAGSNVMPLPPPHE